MAQTQDTIQAQAMGGTRAAFQTDTSRMDVDLGPQSKVFKESYFNTEFKYSDVGHETCETDIHGFCIFAFTNRCDYTSTSNSKGLGHANMCIRHMEKLFTMMPMNHQFKEGVDTCPVPTIDAVMKNRFYTFSTMDMDAKKDDVQLMLRNYVNAVDAKEMQEISHFLSLMSQERQSVANNKHFNVFKGYLSELVLQCQYYLAMKSHWVKNLYIGCTFSQTFINKSTNNFFKGIEQFQVAGQDEENRLYFVPLERFNMLDQIIMLYFHNGLLSADIDLAYNVMTYNQHYTFGHGFGLFNSISNYSQTHNNGFVACYDKELEKLLQEQSSSWILDILVIPVVWNDSKNEYQRPPKPIFLPKSPGNNLDILKVASAARAG